MHFKFLKMPFAKSHLFKPKSRQYGGVPPLQGAIFFNSLAIDAPGIDNSGGDFDANSLQRSRHKRLIGLTIVFS
jgi:hypothetical protein